MSENKKNWYNKEMEDAKIWLEYVSSQMNKCSNRNGRSQCDELLKSAYQNGQDLCECIY